MQQNVQKSRSTTFPRRPERVRGREVLSQSIPEGNSGARTRDVRGDAGIRPPGKRDKGSCFSTVRGSFWIGKRFFARLVHHFAADAHGGRRVSETGEKDLYVTQKAFFLDAYRSNRIGWPRTGVSLVVRTAFRMGYLNSGARVLEIGCGEGRNLLGLHLGGCSVVGMDYVREPLRSAKIAVPEDIFLVQGDLFSLPFREQSFDAVLDWGVFHHLKKPERARYPKWLYRLVAPDGLLLLGAFSEKFQHHPDDFRRQMFVRHRGHYDVFFDKEQFSRAMEPDWTLLWQGEEDQGDGLSHYRLGIFRRVP